MTIDDIISALRNCLEHGGNKDCRIDCPYVDQSCGACAHEQMLYDAADALEAAEKRIKELESQAAFFDAEKLNYQENIVYRDERIKELEAQLPKDGEWLDAKGDK